MYSEEQLIQKSKDGDIKAFEILIDKHQKKVYNMAYQYLGNFEDALDASQEAFLKIFKSLKSFKEESSFSTWIYRICVNVYIDELRKRKKNDSNMISSIINTEDGELELPIVDTAPLPDELLEQKEIKREIWDAINNLSSDYKTIIILRDINGLQYNEISEVLGCSLGTVKSRISRARNALKILLSDNKELLKSYNVK
jgi:RNA polymerase sigma-70 factor (ECF subfamily)